MKVQEYYFTLACLFMDRIWMYLVCHQLFKQPALKVVNKTEFHAHSYAECRGGGGYPTQDRVRMCRPVASCSKAD